MGSVHKLHTNAVEKQRKNSYEGYIAPEYLQDFIPACETRTIAFRTEKSLRSYRSMLYSINRQGDYRYRTIRSETDAYGLVIWRMK